jgi:hypothetical protein
MTLEIKNPIIPLCDRGHGEMIPAELVNDFGDRSPAARCPVPLCNRVYTPLNGYRDLDGQNPPRDHYHRDPKCSTHHYYWMYARLEIANGELSYLCPAEGCEQAKTTGPKGKSASA